MRKMRYWLWEMWLIIDDIMKGNRHQNTEWKKWIDREKTKYIWI